ncbi:hypothetical protein D3C71_881440 [compost metagenome]
MFGFSAVKSNRNRIVLQVLVHLTGQNISLHTYGVICANHINLRRRSIRVSGLSRRIPDYDSEPVRTYIYSPIYSWIAGNRDIRRPELMLVIIDPNPASPIIIGTVDSKFAAYARIRI